MDWTTILPILVRVHTRNTHTRFSANPHCCLREEVEKVKKVYDIDDNDEGHRVIATYIHTRSMHVISGNVEPSELIRVEL